MKHALRPVPTLGGALLLLGASVALGPACKGPDSSFQKMYPDLVVAPDTMDFGGVVVPYDQALELQLINAGRAPLTIDAISMAANGGVYTVSPAQLSLAADESAPVLITFDPATYLDYGTDLVIHSDDPDTPELHVPVVAEGIDGPVPEASVDPLSLDFGTLVAGDSAQQLFTITNTGTGPLEVLPDSSLSDSSVFHLLSDPAGRSISAGDSFPVIVEYDPTTGLGDWARYTVSTNDPLQPTTQVLFIGNGGGEYEHPVAVIDGDTTASPLDTVTFDGTGSYDPQGYTPLSYNWTLLSQPSGSSTRLSDTTASAPSMFLDAAGIYNVLLTVDNAIGVSSEAVVHELIAIPSQELYVLLSWNTGNSDLDLHLVRDDPTLFFQTPDDCCYCNPNPHWGGSGSDDDPELALDNRIGYGPENINLQSPEDGTYYVRVQYFQDNSGGPTEATVKVFIAGEEVDSWSKVMTKNQIWDVATISFPDGLVTEESADLTASTLWTCQ